MNTAKVQKEVLNRLLSNDPVRIQKLDKDVFVSTNGFWATRIPIKNVCFNLEKCTEFNKLSEFFLLDQKDVPLKFTKTMKETPDGVLMKLVPENATFEVWVSRKLLNICGEINLFGSSPIQPIKCQNQITGQIDVVVMPTRVLDEIQGK